MNTVNISLPESDMTFLRKLAKNMGWTIRNSAKKMSGIEEGLKDIEEGRIFKAKSADDMVKQILG